MGGDFICDMKSIGFCAMDLIWVSRDEHVSLHLFMPCLYLSSIACLPYMYVAHSYIPC